MQWFLTDALDESFRASADPRGDLAVEMQNGAETSRISPGNVIGAKTGGSFIHNR